jgi:uncharacterized metal-binding protein YceD (DUF177 family)
MMDKAPPIAAAPSPTDAPAGVPTQILPVSQLMAKRRTSLRFTPDADQRRAVAEVLGLLDLPAFRFDAEVEPQGRDLVLTGQLSAHAVQACIVTLAPVPSRIHQEVRRRFLADWQDPEGDEAEIPEDDTIEPMPVAIDLAGVAIEALALALPEYPRAKGAELGAQEFPPPGATEETETRKPLADLAAMLARKESET